MNQRSRTDRIIVALALLALLLAGGFFYFDEWMWGARRSRGHAIGVVVNRQGDVRLKYEGDLKWSKAASGEDLVYNDAVYAGPSSKADLRVGESHLTVSENTLVVLRRDQNVNFLNLDYGVLFGRVATGEKVIVETSGGKPIEFKSTKDAKIVLRRTDGKTSLDVTGGEAEITVDGVKRRVGQSSRLVIGDKTVEELKANHLRIIKPTHDQLLTAEDRTRIDFNWAWDNGRPANANETYLLEFSADSSFKRIHATKRVQGALGASMAVRQSLSLYYRVKSGEETSAIEQVRFLRLEKAIVVQPVAQQRILAPKGRGGSVAMEFKRPAQATVWYQLGGDPEFKQVVVNQNTPDLILTQELPVGQYYLRARADFGNNNVSSWSDVVPFAVEPALDILPLASRQLPSRVMIPNAAYPPQLYSAKSERVKQFLYKRGLLGKFFAFRDGEVDEIDLRFENADKRSYRQSEMAWPEDKLYPGRYHYRFQARKAGYAPSHWSSPKKLDIVMEPPRPVGEAAYGPADEKGLRGATWGFTPLLFARSYDVEVSPHPGFPDPVELSTAKPQVETPLPEGEYFWRVRARDKFGRIISPFSKPYKLAPMPAIVPPMLAKKPGDSIRKPAQAAERTATRVQRVRERPWESSGWWAWVGSGVNYVDYKQSIPSRGTLNAHHVKGPSKYFEGGFDGGNGIGGILGFKDTPGEFSIPGVPIDPNTFRWTTMSIEAVAKKTSPFTIFRAPITYGMRAGLQQHSVPFLFLPADAESLLLRNNQMSTASFGLLAETNRNRWNYYWLMRYQFPLTSKAEGATVFSMSPVFAFDGSLGTSYSFTKRLKVGMFWYGQWHQFKFTYGNDDVTNAGFQSLFYSNIDLRLGLDF